MRSSILPGAGVVSSAAQAFRHGQPHFDIEAETVFEHLRQAVAPRLARLGSRPGSLRLVANLVAPAPGMRAFPFHSHRANDELFHVLSGTGELRLGARTHPIRAGDFDFIACPAAGYWALPQA